MSKNQMIIRIDAKIKSKLSRMAKAEGKNSSEIIRELIAGYLQKHDLSGYIDDLWNRISSIMKQNQVSETDISEAIREFRGKK